MSYLPPDVLQRTQFPEGSGEDIRTSILEADELWEVSFPTVQYSMLDKQVTPSTTDDAGTVDPDKLSGTSPGSQFDVMWAESMDPEQTTWVQPHGTSGAVAAADVSVFKAAVPVHARAERVDDEIALKRYGFDNNAKWIGGMLFTFTCHHMDEKLLRVGAGDKVLWDTDEWYVDEPHLVGAWYNTNVYLYVTAICTRRRHGD